MTFEGFDAAPLIEHGGFTPATGLPVPEGTGEGTLEAALHQLGGGRAAIDPHDLWLGHGAPLDGRTGLAALLATAAHGPTARLDLLPPPEPDHVPHGKPGVLWAAFDDVDGDGQDDDPIIVTGSRPEHTYALDFGGGIGGVGAVTPGPGGLGAHPVRALPTQQTELADATPCVDEIPAGVDLAHINDMAKALGTELGRLQDRDGWEYGAIIYMAPNGQLYESIPFTAHHRDDLFGVTIYLPAGARIVGYVHTHPTDMTMDQRMLSGVDRALINSLVGRTGNVTADSNMLAYVTTKDKDQMFSSNTYSTFVYDKSKRTADSPGCDL